jgi:hypothetical protein
MGIIKDKRLLSYYKIKKKRLLQDYKTLIKHLKKEAEYLNGEVKDCIKVLEGFEKFIAESMLYIKDRDNLISSHICNNHRNRVLIIQSVMKRFPAWSSQICGFSDGIADAKSVFEYQDILEKQTKELIDAVGAIDKSAGKDDGIAVVPEYIQNINIKLITVNRHLIHLEELYLAALSEYRALRRMKASGIKELIGGGKT